MSHNVSSPWRALTSLRSMMALLFGAPVLAAVTPNDAANESVIGSALTVDVRGVVRDAATNVGIPGTQIVVTPSGGTAVSAQSASDGSYHLSVSIADRSTALQVQARRLGYQAQSVQRIATKDSVQVDFALHAAVASLSAVTVASPTAAPYVGRTRGIVAEAAASVNGARMASPPATTAMRKSVADRRADASKRESRQNGVYDSLAPYPDWNREQYDRIVDNPFLGVRGNPRSTFSVDVDRASYGNVRRFLTQGQAPPADAVRIEEMVNYFPYHLETPRGDAPVAITTEVTAAPWQTKHQLVRIALQARKIETEKLPANNLVFLIDVSGSMNEPNKLPLVQSSLRLLVEQLRPQDRVALVVYAGNAGVVLPPTDGNEKARIMEAIDRLEAGGSTAGGAGIELAYRTAREHYMAGGNNRVILATDGDFNVGVSSDAELERLIERKREEGTYLTVLGFGMGNYQDAKMKKLAKIGNGNYAYIDQIDEARKMLVREMGATLVTVANDVKLQVEFNPARVAAYRLIGYEDRLLRDEDFNDDKKDAGDMGAGHTVTALYEVVPKGVTGTVKVRESDPLRYTAVTPSGREDNARAAGSDELLYVNLRYKTPGETASKLIGRAVRAGDVKARASDDLRFAASVASFGMLLRNSEYKGDATGASVLQLARDASGEDDYRREFVRLVERWQEISRGIAARPAHREP